MTTAALLDRLDHVRQSGPDRWVARCPAHDDRSPSLSIRETDDGVTLFKCFAGCDATAVVHAVGLEISDLFPPRTDHHCGLVPRLPRSSRPSLTVHELVTLLRHSVTVVMLAVEQLASGQALSAEDLEGSVLKVEIMD
jgi:hypothetical protein